VLRRAEMEEDMSNQEMQFADPDWKPSQQLDAKTSPQAREAYNPQPINADPREQSQWRESPPSPPQQGVYSGLPPYAGSTPQQRPAGDFRQQRYSRRGRGRGPWFWIILAIIFLSLASGGFRSMKGFGNGFHFGNDQAVQPVETHDYAVNGQSTVVINDTSGTIHVSVGGKGTDVFIQATKQNGFFGNPNDIKVDYSQNGNTINASVPGGAPGSVDFEITVPQGTDLQLNTISGDINVEGVSGQMALTTTSGDIHTTNDGMTGASKIVTNSGDVTATQDTLSGQTTITTTSGGITASQDTLKDQATMITNSGDINFDGTIDTNGTYQFRSVSGTIDVTVPGTSVFHLDASTTSGSIDFPGASVQFNNPGSGETASGNVGGNPQSQRATVTIHSESGDIKLHQQ